MNTNANQINIDKITIPDDRFERDIGDLSDLKESIQSYGVIEPIILTDDNQLIAGMRRLTASKELNLETIPFVYFKDLTPFEQKEIELIENVHRKNMSWSEVVKAQSELHKLKVEQFGEAKQGARTDIKDKTETGWTLNDTADLLGIKSESAKSEISKSIKLADAIALDPDLAQETSKKNALAKMKRKQIEEIRAELARRASKKIKKHFIQGKFEDVLDTFEDGTFSLLLTDIPYGIDINNLWSKSSGRLKHEATEFDDKDGEDILNTIKESIDNINRVLAPGSHVYIFCSFAQVSILQEIFSANNFYVRSIPLIWDKKLHGVCPQPQWAFAHRYECIFHAKKGSREYNIDAGEINPSLGDVLEFKRVNSTNKIGINEKPVELMKNIILLSTIENEWVLDICCGTGATVVGALQTNRQAIGIDINQKALDVAISRIDNEVVSLSDEKLVEKTE